MKGIYVAAIAFLAMAAICVADDDNIVIPTECPEVDPMNTTIHLAHESDCTKFYMCFIGQKILRQCPFMDKNGNRLHFNPRLQVCDWPKRAGCKSPKPIPTPTKPVTTPTTPTPTESTTLTPTEPETTPTPTATTTESTTLTPTEPETTPTPTPTESTTLTPTEPETTPTPTPTKPVTTPTTPTPTESTTLTPTEPETTPTPTATTTESTTLTPTEPETTPTPTEGTTTTTVTTSTEGSTTVNSTVTKTTDVTTPTTTDATTVSKDDYDRNSTTTVKIPTTPANECPPVDDKNNKVLLPHETNCSLFYLCSNGSKIIQECPSGLHFNPIIQSCDWPNGCISNATTPDWTITPITETTTETTTLTPKPPKCLPQDNRTYPHECQCDRYYRCKNGDQVLEFCPEGFHYDAVRQICTTPEEAGCIEISTTRPVTESPTIVTETTPVHKPNSTTPTKPTTKPTTPESTPSPVECPADDSGRIIRFPHERNCSLYYECNDGHKNLKECSKGLHFHPILQICDWPENVGCEDIPEIIPKPTPSTGTPKPTPKPITVSTNPPKATIKPIRPSPDTHVCPRTEGGIPANIPHENNCSLYYTCIDGDKILKECPKGLLFHRLLEVCDFPGNTGCPTQIPGGVPPGTITRCSKVSAETTVHIPHETNCSLFYTCDGGVEILQHCPRGLQFHSILRVCDWPENVKCKNDKPVNSDNRNPDSVDFESRSSTVGSRDVPTSPVTIAVDNNEKDKTSGRPTAESSVSTVKTTIDLTGACIGTCPTEDPFNYTIHLPHEDCTKFCQCSNGKPYVLSCPSGLHFDPVLLVCNRPKEAGCVGKVTTKSSQLVDDESREPEVQQQLSSRHWWQKIPVIGRLFS